MLAHNGDLFEEKLRDTIDAALSPLDQIRRTARFYFEHWTENPAYFQIFWAIENQEVIGELGDRAVREVTRLWENCLHVLAGVVERGVREGAFAPCDAWEVANLFWTLANGIIQTEHAPVRRRLRQKPLEESYRNAIELVLRGLTPAA